jgi:alanine dehydrogenase
MVHGDRPAKRKGYPLSLASSCRLQVSGRRDATLAESATMKIFDARVTREFLPWPSLVEALRTMFRSGCEMPRRHHHEVEVPGEPAATLLLMPAWVCGEHLGVKVVNVMPGNSTRGLPTVVSNYLLSDARTGQMLALIDGSELTSRRTAAASALAASYLARPDASHLLVVGTGQLALNMVAAHASVRPIRRVSVWGRRAERAQAIAGQVRTMLGLEAEPVDDLEAAVRQAHIVSTITLASEPLVRGAWLQPGAHLDLVGAFRPDMRESDDDALRRASVFVDTRDGACTEGGELVQALAKGVLTPELIRADLHELVRGAHPGRIDAAEITLFKSVGTALEDLAAARLVWQLAAAAAQGLRDA